LNDGKGLAIHLDAQQRLVVFSANRYCAEPSPDALAAYAASLGLSGSVLPTKSAAASAAMNSVAGSIGLRTQSITLMRDTLYRICEQRLSNSISDEQVAVLLARSQDLTAVILAIEQLTGAVAAPSVALTTAGGSSALASLTANTQALNAATEAEAKAKADSDDAEKLRLAAETERNSAQAELTALRKSLADNPTDDGSAAAVKKQEGVLQEKQAGLDSATQAARLKEDAYKRLQETAAQVAAARDAATNSTTSSVIGGVEAGEISRGSKLSDKAVAAIAKTVEDLVKKLLDKRYFEDTCLAVLTSPGAREALQAAKELQTYAIRDVDRSKARIDAYANIEATNKAVKLAQTIQTTQGELISTCLAYFKNQATDAGRTP
jgi:hypothetical protein